MAEELDDHPPSPAELDALLRPWGDLLAPRGYWGGWDRSDPPPNEEVEPVDLPEA